MTSNFGAEFTSLKKATEEAVALRHYCRAFGMRVSTPTVVYEDNMSLVINITNPGSTLQHKSMTLSHHFVRERCYGDVVEVRKIASDKNFSDALTKGLDSSGLNNCIMPVMSN